jgi:hypothetical protein
MPAATGLLEAMTRWDSGIDVLGDYVKKSDTSFN